MQQPRAHTQVRPYAVKENGDYVNVVFIALKFTSRCHFDQVERSGTRGEISFGDAALFPVREISRLNHFVILPFGHRSK